MNSLLYAGWFTFGSFDFSKNGLWIAAGSSRGNARDQGSISIFDIATGKEVWAALGAHSDYMYNVDFGADDTTIASGAGDGVSFLWDLSTVPENVNPGKPTLDVAKLEEAFADPLKALVSDDAAIAFAIFQRLAKQPEEGLDKLNEGLNELANQEVSEEQVSKWLVALRSDNNELATKAKTKLHALGPAAKEFLDATLELESLTEDRRNMIAAFSFQIQHQYQRPLKLLAQLDSEAAKNCLNEIARNGNSKVLKRMAFDALRTR